MKFLNSYQRARILLGTAAVICFLIFWWVGGTFGIPPHRGYQVSLLQQPSPGASFLIVAVALLACALIGTAVAGMIRYNAGVVAATIGLSALPFRGGSGRYTIFWGLATVDDRVMTELLLELVALTVLVGVCWSLVRMAHRQGLIRDRIDRATAGQPKTSAPPTLCVMYLAAQFIATFIIVAIVAQTEARQQALAAVFIAGFLGPVAGEELLAELRRFKLADEAQTRSVACAWVWLPPLLVGILGYALNLHSPGLHTADITGTLAGLARPLPLDYASAGPAGALIGQWLARQWYAPEPPETQRAAASPAT